MKRDVERYLIGEDMDRTLSVFAGEEGTCKIYFPDDPVLQSIGTSGFTHAYMDNTTAEVPRTNLYTSSIKDFLGT
ncbi:hypothetical protein BGAL_0351g00070 [Botrytis galanthina]|uniref:Uncharacterized protein n=1 Tax=Botrytis galanthina TaxID=278940 RepID=A0A4S8QYY2_9HELO|nr:hypothetical protein BGAL_0351g00070 [Botrytis galanthina]